MKMFSRLTRTGCARSQPQTSPPPAFVDYSGVDAETFLNDAEKYEAYRWPVALSEEDET
jgi:hypothetical protein